MFARQLLIVFITLAVISQSIAVTTQCDYGFSDGSQNLLKLPPNFLFGAGSSAAQIEGAWNEDGKGPSEWDQYWHKYPDRISDHTTPDVSCDSYHFWKDDVNALKEIGLNAYRFSLSWSRLLPTGEANNINKKAVEYYSAIIDALLENGITPVVTLFHFDMPLNMSKLGGWSNKLSIRYFSDYAEFAFKTFGQKVKHWITINEPGAECSVCYGSAFGPPGVNISGIADYLCGHNILLAHATAYHLYHSMPDISDGGQVGITMGFDYYFPKDNRSLSDRVAAQVGIDFTFGWFANPLVGSGDYPASMRARVDERSFQEGRLRSRLPYFTAEQILFIRDATDFIGINHYTSMLASFIGFGINGGTYSNADSGVVTSFDPSWKKTAQFEFKFVPWGFGAVLRYLRDHYGNPYVFVTENGYAGFSNENLQCNPDRELWFKEYIAELLKAVLDNCNVHGYFVWSLLDDFEWNDGYMIKFGIAHVDFSTTNRTRTVKGIQRLFQNIMKYGLPVNDIESQD